MTYAVMHAVILEDCKLAGTLVNAARDCHMLHSGKNDFGKTGCWADGGIGLEM